MIHFVKGVVDAKGILKDHLNSTPEAMHLSLAQLLERLALIVDGAGGGGFQS